MVQGQILNIETMGNQQPSLEKRKVQRLERKFVDRKRLAVPSGGHLVIDEDIVCTSMKVEDAVRPLGITSDYS